MQGKRNPTGRARNVCVRFEGAVEGGRLGDGGAAGGGGGKGCLAGSWG